MNRINVGNATITGFVNLTEGNRLVIGTGSYTAKDGAKVYKESVTVFLDEKFNGEVPAKGDFVQASGDLVISPRKDKADVLQATMNLRFANQLVKTEPPKAKSDSGEGDI